MLRLSDLSTLVSTEAGMARAFDAVSLPIARGATLAFVGESGCGK